MQFCVRRSPLHDKDTTLSCLCLAFKAVRAKKNLFLIIWFVLFAMSNYSKLSSVNDDFKVYFICLTLNYIVINRNIAKCLNKESYFVDTKDSQMSD